MKTFRCLFLIIIFLSFVCSVNSQTDTHYWTHQYGAKGLLLNGAVIASTEDETAIFYNPGAMGFGDNLGLSFSFFTPTFSVLKTSNLLGEGTSFDDKGFDLSPGFLAIRFKPFNSNKITAGITTFTRFKSDLKFKDRVVNNLSNIASLLYVADLKFERKLSEYWFGYGMSYRPIHNFSFGFTQFMVWHGEHVNLDFKKEILDKDEPSNLLISWRSNFEYGFSANSGFLTKLGLSWQPGNVKFGLTFTSPTYSFLLKDANYAIDDQKVFPQDSSYVFSNRRDIPLEEYKTPMSIGFGIDFQLKDTRISMAFEYFKDIETYSLFRDVDDPLDGISSVDEEQITEVTNGNQRAFNFAIGIQKFHNEHVTLLGGFRTDFNQKNNFRLNEGIEFLATTPDIYHISAGGMFNKGKNQFSFGFDYGFGVKSGGRQLTDFTNISLDNLFTFSGEQNVKTYSHTFMIYMTYDFLFKNIETED
jgi:hypothetical protein